MRESYDLKTPNGRQQFILDTWPGTAGLAYAGFKIHDRGAVVFAPGYNFPMYVPRLTDYGYNNYPSLDVEKAVNHYDPEKEIVVVFFLQDESVVFGRFQNRSMPPPQAYHTFSRMI